MEYVIVFAIVAVAVILVARTKKKDGSKFDKDRIDTPEK